MVLSMVTIVLSIILLYTVLATVRLFWTKNDNVELQANLSVHEFSGQYSNQTPPENGLRLRSPDMRQDFRIFKDIQVDVIHPRSPSSPPLRPHPSAPPLSLPPPSPRPRRTPRYSVLRNWLRSRRVHSVTSSSLLSSLALSPSSPPWRRTPCCVLRNFFKKRTRR